jgi:hypothetical protein
MLAMQRPSRQAHNAFARKLRNDRSNSQEDYTALEGLNAGLYNNRFDLVALKRTEAEDRLTNFLRKHCAGLFKASASN